MKSQTFIIFVFLCQDAKTKWKQSNHNNTLNSNWIWKSHKGLPLNNSDTIKTTNAEYFSTNYSSKAWCGCMSWITKQFNLHTKLGLLKLYFNTWNTKTKRINLFWYQEQGNLAKNLINNCDSLIYLTISDNILPKVCSSLNLISNKLIKNKNKGDVLCI